MTAEEIQTVLQEIDQKHRKPMIRAALRIFLKKIPEAEIEAQDVVQDTIIKFYVVYLQKGQFEHHKGFGILYVILQNLCKDRLRLKKFKEINLDEIIINELTQTDYRIGADYLFERIVNDEIETYLRSNDEGKLYLMIYAGFGTKLRVKDWDKVLSLPENTTRNRCTRHAKAILTAIAERLLKELDEVHLFQLTNNSTQPSKHRKLVKTYVDERFKHLTDTFEDCLIKHFRQNMPEFEQKPLEEQYTLLL